jgi:hypothetical protein
VDYEQIKEEIKQIADISSSVPEVFRDKCFELLLSNLLKSDAKNLPPQTAEPTEPVSPPAEPARPQTVESNGLPMKTQLRVMMRRTGITAEDIEKVLFFDNGQVHFVKEPRNVAVATGQIEWALLLALKNAIENDSFAADPEAVRSMCQEKGFYDVKNFAANFKREGNAKFFKSPLAPQGESQQITPEGQDALAKLIKRLGADTQ